MHILIYNTNINNKMFAVLAVEWKTQEDLTMLGMVAGRGTMTRLTEKTSNQRQGSREGTARVGPVEVLQRRAGRAPRAVPPEVSEVVTVPH